MNGDLAFMSSRIVRLPALRSRGSYRRFLQSPLLVLGVLPGGVPVAYEVTHVLNAPHDFMLVRKISMPGQPELVIGAIASGYRNIVVREPTIAKEILNLATRFDRLIDDQRRELERRKRVYRLSLAPTSDASDVVRHWRMARVACVPLHSSRGRPCCAERTVGRNGAWARWNARWLIR
jgi:hypothetical protein